MQPVIRQQYVDLRVRLQQGGGRQGSSRVDGNRRPRDGVQQGGFIPQMGAVRRVVAEPWRGAGTRAIASAEDAGAPALGLQKLTNGRRDRGLARAADQDVADDDDRHGRSPGLCCLPGHVPGGQSTIEPGKGGQHGAGHALCPPDVLQTVFCPSAPCRLHGRLCVRKETRRMSACRAASRASTTAAWDVWPSASMRSAASGCSIAAWRSAAVRVSGVTLST